MRSSVRNLLVVATVAATGGLPQSALAQSGPPPALPERAPSAPAVTLLGEARRAGMDVALAPAKIPGDPVSDGIVIGALIGAGAGLSLMAWLYNRCDGSCDAPEPAPMYLSAAGLGAAVGALAGWGVDAARRSSSRRVSVGAAVAPRRQSVKVAVRF